jgi:hypothetical protein
MENMSPEVLLSIYILSGKGRIYRKVENFRISSLLVNKNKLQTLVLFSCMMRGFTLSGKVRRLNDRSYCYVKPRAVLEAVFA